jgi:hypothetical protein
VIYRALPGGSDLIIIYYCLMAMWTGLGNNTELFWAVLSHLPTCRRRYRPTHRRAQHRTPATPTCTPRILRRAEPAPAQPSRKLSNRDKFFSDSPPPPPRHGQPSCLDDEMVSETPDPRSDGWIRAPLRWILPIGGPIGRTITLPPRIQPRFVHGARRTRRSCGAVSMPLRCGRAPPTTAPCIVTAFPPSM